MLERPSVDDSHTVTGWSYMIVERGHVGHIRAGRRTRSVVPVDQTTPGYRERKPRIGGRGQSRQLVRPRDPRIGGRILIRQREFVEDREHVIEVVVRDRWQALAGDVSDEDATAMAYRTLTSWQAWWVREQAPTWVAREEVRQRIRAACARAGVTLDERAVHSLASDHGADGADALEIAYPRDIARAVLHDGLGVRRLASDPPVSQTLTIAQLAGRFNGYHDNDPVWVIDHEVAIDDRPKLLADRPGSTLEDYVHSPAAAMSGSRDPGEAVDGAAQERCSRAAGERDAERRRAAALERHSLPLGERIRRLQEQKDIDLSSDLRLIAHRANKAADRLKAAGVEE